MQDADDVTGYTDQPRSPLRLISPERPAHQPLLRTQTSEVLKRLSSNSTEEPLRSALEDPDRSRATTVNGPLLSVPVPRTQTQSGTSDDRHSISQTSTNSSPRADPDHVFLLITPPNGLELSNLASEATVEELREQMLPMWPKGVAGQERHKHDWRVTFTGSPWDSKGNELILAQRMICRVFWVLADQEYMYLTSIETGHVFKSPRLVFIHAPTYGRADFFAMSLNSTGNGITFVDPPAAVVNSLGLSLSTAFPHRIVNEHESDDGIFTITLNSGINAMGPERNLFIAHILKYINDMAFKLDASVPLARRGLFGMSGCNEIWVFKGPPSRK